MTARPGCLHFDQITALLEERLPTEERAEVVRHLDSCALCQWRLERSTGATKELSTLAQSAQREQPALGPAFLKAVESLKQVSVGDPAADDGDMPARPTLGFLQESQNPQLLGRFGRYEVLETIGRGGMGIVFKARDPLLDRITAIKVLDPLLAGHETARLRFVREARAAAAICHENVIVIHGVAERDGLPYLVMPYIHGMSLAEKLQWFGPLELVEILRIGMQIAAGLAAAHAQGVVHRDIKPANILLEGDVDRVKITDFGLAQVVDDTSLTHPGTIAGTPEYMSPEQAQEAPIDHRSDLFSLGSVLYAMCTGLPPFSGTTTMAVIRRVCDDEPRPISQINPDIPDWLVRIIARLHQKRPEDRWQSATHVCEVLRQHLVRLQSPGSASAPVPTPAPSPASEGTLPAAPAPSNAAAHAARSPLTTTHDSPLTTHPSHSGWKGHLTRLRTSLATQTHSIAACGAAFWRWVSRRAGRR